jgi:hypothetical protein
LIDASKPPQRLEVFLTALSWMLGDKRGAVRPSKCCFEHSWRSEDYRAALALPVTCDVDQHVYNSTTSIHSTCKRYNEKS